MGRRFATSFHYHWMLFLYRLQQTMIIWMASCIPHLSKTTELSQSIISTRCSIPVEIVEEFHETHSHPDLDKTFVPIVHYRTKFPLSSSCSNFFPAQFVFQMFVSTTKSQYFVKSLMTIKLSCGSLPGSPSWPNVRNLLHFL